jgi:hypothetical protein
MDGAGCKPDNNNYYSTIGFNDKEKRWHGGECMDAVGQQRYLGSAGVMDDFRRRAEMWG